MTRIHSDTTDAQSATPTAPPGPVGIGPAGGIVHLESGGLSPARATYRRLVILDHGFGASLEQHFDAELERCREITLAEWEARPWSAWFKSWFAHLFAYWL